MPICQGSVSRWMSGMPGGIGSIFDGSDQREQVAADREQQIVPVEHLAHARLVRVIAPR